MGGRGSAGRSRVRGMTPATPVPVPEDPILPPEATFRPEDRDPAPVDPPVDRAATEQAHDPGAVPQTDAEVEDHVLDTVARLERTPGAYVTLTDVRAALHPDLDRAAVDAAMARINGRRGAVFVSEDAQETLTDADRDAALRIGNQANHMIALDGPRPTPAAAAPGGGDNVTVITGRDGSVHIHRTKNTDR